MSVELKLDRSALEALFPEGTEARVKLQQAVIQNFAQSYIKGSKDTVLNSLQPQLVEMKKQISNELMAQEEEFMKTILTKSGGAWSSSLKLTDEGKKLILREAHSKFNGLISKDLHDLTTQKVHGALAEEHLTFLIDQQINNKVAAILELKREQLEKVTTEIFGLSKALTGNPDHG